MSSLVRLLHILIKLTFQHLPNKGMKMIPSELYLLLFDKIPLWYYIQMLNNFYLMSSFCRSHCSNISESLNHFFKQFVKKTQIHSGTKQVTILLSEFLNHYFRHLIEANIGFSEKALLFVGLRVLNMYITHTQLLQNNNLFQSGFCGCHKPFDGEGLIMVELQIEVRKCL